MKHLLLLLQNCHKYFISFNNSSVETQNRQIVPWKAIACDERWLRNSWFAVSFYHKLTRSPEYRFINSAWWRSYFVKPHFQSYFLTEFCRAIDGVVEQCFKIYKLTKIETRLQSMICVFVVLFAPSHFPAGFCAQNSVDYCSNLGRQQNYLLFKLLRVIYLA